jgi:hypothetical protein
MRNYSAGWLTWSLAVLLACSQERGNEGARTEANAPSPTSGVTQGSEQAVPNAQESTMNLEWEFEADTQETAVINSLLREVIDVRLDRPVGKTGVIHRFASARAQRRYLLMTYLENGNTLEEPEAVLFVLQIAQPRVSDHLVIGRWGIGSWGPVEINDYDNDVQPDVAYCDWPSEDARKGAVRVKGYLNGSWYSIRKPHGSVPGCQA